MSSRKLYDIAMSASGSVAACRYVISPMAAIEVYSVEKLCLEKCDDFICDLSDITYCRYEGVAEVA